MEEEDDMDPFKVVREIYGDQKIEGNGGLGIYENRADAILQLRDAAGKTIGLGTILEECVPEIAPRRFALTHLGEHGKVYMPRSGIYTIGRHNACDIYISCCGEISRIHALLSVHTDRFVLRDLASRNGTFVNNTKLDAKERRELHHGDLIKLGAQNFRVELIS